MSVLLFVIPKGNLLIAVAVAIAVVVVAAVIVVVAVVRFCLSEGAGAFRPLTKAHEINGI